AGLDIGAMFAVKQNGLSLHEEILCSVTRPGVSKTIFYDGVGEVHQRIRKRARVDAFFYVNCTRMYRYCIDRKSTRLNSSHVKISYAVFCLKKKNTYVIVT